MPRGFPRMWGAGYVFHLQLLELLAKRRWVLQRTPVGVGSSDRGRSGRSYHSISLCLPQGVATPAQARRHSWLRLLLVRNCHCRRSYHLCLLADRSSAGVFPRVVRPQFASLWQSHAGQRDRSHIALQFKHLRRSEGTFRTEGSACSRVCRVCHHCAGRIIRDASSFTLSGWKSYRSRPTN